MICLVNALKGYCLEFRRWKIVNLDDKKSIHVFNEKFIDSNIKIKENGIDSIVMFGEQVNIDKQIEETNSEIRFTEISSAKAFVCKLFFSVGKAISNSLLQEIMHNVHTTNNKFLIFLF